MIARTDAIRFEANAEYCRYSKLWVPSVHDHLGGVDGVDRLYWNVHSNTCSHADYSENGREATRSSNVPIQYLEVHLYSLKALSCHYTDAYCPVGLTFGQA